MNKNTFKQASIRFSGITQKIMNKNNATMTSTEHPPARKQWNSNQYKNIAVTKLQNGLARCRTIVLNPYL